MKQNYVILGSPYEYGFNHKRVACVEELTMILTLVVQNVQ